MLGALVAALGSAQAAMVPVGLEEGSAAEIAQQLAAAQCGNAAAVQSAALGAVCNLLADPVASNGSGALGVGLGVAGSPGLSPVPMQKSVADGGELGAWQSAGGGVGGGLTSVGVDSLGGMQQDGQGSWGGGGGGGAAPPSLASLMDALHASCEDGSMSVRGLGPGEVGEVGLAEEQAVQEGRQVCVCVCVLCGAV